MFTVELYARIRRAVMVDGLSRREAATRFGVHRNTITKMLQNSIPPGYRRRERPASKASSGPQMAWIDALLRCGSWRAQGKRRSYMRNGYSSASGMNGDFPAAIRSCASMWQSNVRS